jgi:PHD/YefM family antitoxin component YafN of YafNO toxin-antitoxin module
MIDIANDIQSLSYFKRNSAKALARMKKSKKPLVLTVNGKATAVVQDPVSYQRKAADEEHAEMIAFLKESLADTDAGRTVPAREFIESLRRKL